jgi:hypothetical protein
MRAQLAVDHLVRDLSEQTGPITRAIGRPGSAMIESFKTFDAKPGQPVGGCPIESSDESDATGVVLESWIYEWSGHVLPNRERGIVNPMRPLPARGHHQMGH